MISSQIGKVYLLNRNFSAIWESFRSIGNFFSQLGKSLVPQIRPSFVKRKSPECTLYETRNLESQYIHVHCIINM